MKSNIKSINGWLLLVASLFIMAFGVGFSIKANLGTSPISSLPYVAGQIIGLTVGTATIIMHCVFILLQIIILRDKYEWIQLLQLPVALLFGNITDFALGALSFVQPAGYAQQWLCCGIGIVLIAVGVSLEVAARVVTLAGEGFILAVSRVSRINFGTMKIIFDVSLVTIACILSLIFLHGIYGVREGTVAAAVLVGVISKRLNKYLAAAAARRAAK